MGERIANGFLLLCALLYLLFASQLSFGSMRSPSAGFIPIIVGSAATIIAAVLFAKSLFRHSDFKDVNLNVDIKKTLMIIGTLLLYILMLMTVGYIIATIIAIFILLKITEVKGWMLPIVISISGSLVFYTLFKIYLGVNLP